MPKAGLNKLALELEAQGYTVIRAREHGSPDLIAFPPESGPLIQIHGIVIQDMPTALQQEAFEALRSKGVQIQFHSPKIRVRRTRAEMEAKELENSQK